MKKDSFKNSIAIEEGDKALLNEATQKKKLQGLAETAFFVYDVKTKKRLDEYRSDVISASGSSGVLIFTCEASLKAVLEPLCEGLMPSLTRWMRAMGRFEPTVLNLLIERHWASHFSKEQLAGINRYFLVKRRLYPLNALANASDSERIHVLRQKALLEFSLSSDYFIQLEPHDRLVLLETKQIKLLKAEKKWKTLLAFPSVAHGFLKIDDHLPKANLGVQRGKKCRQVEWIGRWLLFCFYAGLTGFVLFTVFWIL